MKNLTLIILTCFLLVCSSCGGDNEPSIMGELSYNGEVYTVTNSLGNLKLTGDTYSVFVVHFSDGLWLEDKEGTTPQGGTSSLLTLTLKSTDVESIADDLYQYDEWEPQPWEEGPIFFGAFFDEFEKSLETRFDRGTIDVSGNYPDLQFTLDLYDENGDNLSGTVSGSFQFTDISD